MQLTLRAKFLLLFAVGLLTLFGVQYFTARLVILEQFESLEQEKAAAALERIASLFNDQTQQLAATVSDWAAWDDTYRFAGEDNADYLASNYTDTTNTRLKIDAIVLATPQGDPLHIHARRHSDQQPWQLPDNLLARLKELMLRNRAKATAESGVLALKEGRYLLALHPILTSEEKGPSRGFLTMIRVMDDAYVETMADLAHAPLTLAPLDTLAAEGWSAAEIADLKQSGRKVITRDNGNRGAIRIQDLLGAPPLAVQTVMDRKIYQQGVSSLHFFLLSSVVILVVLVVFSLLFDRLVLGPLSRLSREIGVIGANGKITMRVTTLPGQDELSHLSQGINTMLTRLESTLGALQRSQDRLRLAAQVLENSNELILVSDARNTIVMVNQGFCRITGYHPMEVVGLSPRILRSDRHSPEFYAQMWQSLLKHGHWQGEIWNRRKNGEVFPEWLSISLVRDEHGNPVNFIAIGSDLTERKEADRRISQLANYDHLTQLPNRSLLVDRLEQALLNAQLYHRMVGVLVVGLDRFKHLNDSLGHASGDEVLRQVSGRLVAAVAPDTTVARLSGDSFVVVLTHFHDPGVTVPVAQTILDALAHPYTLGGHDVVITASMGVSLFPTDGGNADELLRHGEQAMFRAKDQGRNTVAFYEARMQEGAQERFVLESGLRRAVDNHELILFYQPQIALSGQRLVGAEALIRWRHPQLGMVSPGKFIPVAEESGLVVPIGTWVLETACRQAKAWQQAGLPPVVVAVNVSPLQFRQPGFVELVARVLDKTGLDPHWLELEVTEGMLIQDITTTVAILTELKKIGLHLAIDDFGTGYSSLHYLNRFPLDKLKVDQSFVRGLPADRDNAVIATTIIQLARSLNLRVIAEGVETREQLEFLQERGCDEVQGYLFDKPLPVQEFEERLRRAAG